jgi:hypothetical protein
LQKRIVSRLSDVSLVFISFEQCRCRCTAVYHYGQESSIGTVMRITHRDAGDAVNDKTWIPSWCGNVFRGRSHSLERTLLALFMVAAAPDQGIVSPVCL